MMNNTNISKWPENPYKGLQPYSENDLPLFAGRNEDLSNCIEFLSEERTRILIIHGLSGCGKSSFLRGGIIPYLKDYNFGFAGNSDKIRLYSNPINKIAEIIFNYSQVDYQFNTLDGIKSLKLSDTFSEYINLEEFLNRVNGNPILLIEGIDKLDKKLINRLIIVLDQVENIFTNLFGDEDLEKAQEDFFEFIVKFSQSDISRIKIIISLRTEFLGRFSNRIRRPNMNRLSIGDYYLNDLSNDQLIEAIKRPTLAQELPNFENYGKPRDHYKFFYEDGLVENKILDKLRGLRFGGSVLPVMQVLCKSLYEHTKHKAGSEDDWDGWKIEEEDFDKLKELSELLIGYLDDTLNEIYPDTLNNTQRKFESIKWKKLLSTFSKRHFDGTVTTQIIRQTALKKKAEEFSFESDFDEIIKMLASEKMQLLYKFEILSIKNEEKREKKTLLSYTLCHDSFAMALYEWKEKYDEISKFKVQPYSIEVPGEISIPIVDFSEYKKEHLYGDKKFDTKILYSIDNYIWDHQLILFANDEDQGFFKRLGFELDFKKYKDMITKPSEYENAQDLLPLEDPGKVLISYPRNILKEKLKRISSDFVVIDVYRGYALIGKNREKYVKFDWEEPLKSFKEVLRSLEDCKIIAEDSAALNFTMAINKISVELLKEHIIDDCKPFQVVLHDAQMGSLFECFLRDDVDVDFITVSAPTRALTTQAGYPICLDSNDIKHLLKKILNERNEDFKKKILADSFIHNCWYINIPYNEWESEEYKADILKLASVGLFTVDYLKSNQNAVTNFYLKQLNNNSHTKELKLEKTTMFNIFYRCYHFVDSKDYFDAYFDPESDFSYRSTLNSSTYDNSQNVFSELIRLKNDYQDLIVQYETLINKFGKREKKSDSFKKAKVLKTRSRRHYQIYNYFDAVEMLKEAMKKLKKIKMKGKSNEQK